MELRSSSFKFMCYQASTYLMRRILKYKAYHLRPVIKKYGNYNFYFPVKINSYQDGFSEKDNMLLC